MIRILLLIFISITGFVYQSYAQDETYRPIEKEKWEKAVAGLDYTEVHEEPEYTEMPQQKEPFSLSINWLKVLMFVAIAALLIFILLRIFGKGLFAGNKKIPTAEIITVNDLDDKPMESDLERFLREAIESKNFRLAVRIYYLMLLKNLQDKELIIWKKNKTNFDYLTEVAHHPDFHQLNNSTLIYEYVWYGDQSIGEPQFNSIRGTFLSLINKTGVSK